jgi:hypothetical protein
MLRLDRLDARWLSSAREGGLIIGHLVGGLSQSSLGKRRHHLTPCHIRNGGRRTERHGSGFDWTVQLDVGGRCRSTLIDRAADFAWAA